MLIFVIKKLRERKNLSIIDLCEKTNLSRSYLTKLENNKLDNCSVNVLEKISDALEVNIKDLFYSKSDIETLKKKLNKTVDKYGLSSNEALEISRIIDSLINIMNREKDL